MNQQTNEQPCQPPHLVLSCTIVFILARVSLVISLSRYSERHSVAISKSPWLSYSREDITQSVTLEPDAHLKDKSVIVLLEVEGKRVGVHESLSTLTQNIYCPLHELCFDPRYIHGL